MERKVLQLIGRELKRKKCVASRMSTKTTVLRKKHKNFTIVIGSSELGGRCCELLAQVGTSQPRDTLFCQTRKRPCEVHMCLVYGFGNIKERKTVKSLSCVWLFATPWTVAYQAPLSMGFSRQEYWSGLPFPSPGDLPDPGIEPRSPVF